MQEQRSSGRRSVHTRSFQGGAARKSHLSSGSRALPHMVRITLRSQCTCPLTQRRLHMPTDTAPTRRQPLPSAPPTHLHQHSNPSHLSSTIKIPTHALFNVPATFQCPRPRHPFLVDAPQHDHPPLRICRGIIKASPFAYSTPTPPGSAGDMLHCFIFRQ